MKKFQLVLFVFIGSIIAGGCALICPSNPGYKTNGLDYVQTGTFSLPGKGTKFDLMPDGRILGVSGRDIFVQTEKSRPRFQIMGYIPQLTINAYGPSFFKISPDGQTLAIGDNYKRIGIFKLSDLSGKWFSISHSGGLWMDNTRLIISRGKFSEPSQIVCFDVRSTPDKLQLTPLIHEIGGAPGGMAFDRADNFYAANGYQNIGPSTTGTIKRFSREICRKALNTNVPINFETQGKVIVDILSGASLGFDHRGNLYVGGSDQFGDGVDVNFAAVISKKALDSVIQNNEPIDIGDPDQVRRLDPDKANATSRYDLRFNAITRELYLFSGAAIYVYETGKSAKSPLSSLAETSTLRPGIQTPVVSRPKPKGTIRIMSHNVCGNFMANTRTDQTFERLLAYVSPDILILEEFVISSAPGLASRLEDILGGKWVVFPGMNSGIYQNMIASRFPLKFESRDTHPPSDVRGITAALVDLPDTDFKQDLYVMGLHLQCCNSPVFQAQRQRSVDAVIARIKDAKTPGGQIDLPVKTPVIVGGDLNFSGGPQPEITLATGDIQNEDLFGPDIHPDWDNCDLTDLTPADPNTSNPHTWPSHDPDPHIRYDRFYFTNSAVSSARGFILNTLNFSQKQLDQTGLKKQDTRTASDHLPIVMDIQLPLTEN